MTKEEKLKFAEEFYTKINVVSSKYELKRDEEIKADYVWIADMRGPGGLLIGDDGTFLFCQSAHSFQYWKEEYKKGNRSN